MCLFKGANLLAWNISQISLFRLLVVGGGAGGCGTASKFASKLGKGKVNIV